jgi:hypothetical protein
MMAYSSILQTIAGTLETILYRLRPKKGVKEKQDDHRNLSQLLQTMKQWIDTQITFLYLVAPAGSAGKSRTTRQTPRLAVASPGHGVRTVWCRRPPVKHNRGGVGVVETLPPAASRRHQPAVLTGPTTPQEAEAPRARSTQLHEGPATIPSPNATLPGHAGLSVHPDRLMISAELAASVKAIMIMIQ